MSYSIVSNPPANFIETLTLRQHTIHYTFKFKSASKKRKMTANKHRYPTLRTVSHPYTIWIRYLWQIFRKTPPCNPSPPTKPHTPHLCVPLCPLCPLWFFNCPTPWIISPQATKLNYRRARTKRKTPDAHKPIGHKKSDTRTDSVRSHISICHRGQCRHLQRNGLQSPVGT